MLVTIHGCPPLSRDLMDYLQAVYPNKLPEVMPGPGVVEKLIGQQGVVLHLQAQYDLQNRNSLGNK